MLNYWLKLVALFRFYTTILGYLSPITLRSSVFAGQTKFDDLHGSMFAGWTLTTGLLTWYTSEHLDNPELCQATAGTFVLMICWFLHQYLRKTLLFRNIVSPFIVASISAVWLIMN
jgi:hypothetical protein